MTAKRVLILVAVLLTANLWAGDMATFVDLGFSPDGRTYAFAQYGVQAGTLKPWAELFVVDVVRNNFVSGGRVSQVQDNPVAAGQDGSGVLFNIITRNIALMERHGVNFLFQGQPLFISPDEPASPPRQNVDFRDFVSGASYRASLVSRVEGSGSTLASSFHINLERTGRDGTKKSYIVGTPELKRSQVVSYRIMKVIIAPNDSSMILVVEMKKQNGAEFDIRYMVEALRL
jgi:predicted secreted protein